MIDRDYDNTRSGQIEKAEDRQFEKHFKSHRGVPDGRNFRWWNADKSLTADINYRNNFDDIFPNSPGSGV